MFTSLTSPDPLSRYRRAKFILYGILITCIALVIILAGAQFGEYSSDGNAQDDDRWITLGVLGPAAVLIFVISAMDLLLMWFRCGHTGVNPIVLAVFVMIGLIGNVVAIAFVLMYAGSSYQNASPEYHDYRGVQNCFWPAVVFAILAIPALVILFIVAVKQQKIKKRIRKFERKMASEDEEQDVRSQVEQRSVRTESRHSLEQMSLASSKTKSQK